MEKSGAYQAVWHAAIGETLIKLKPSDVYIVSISLCFGGVNFHVFHESNSNCSDMTLDLIAFISDDPSSRENLFCEKFQKDHFVKIEVLQNKGI